MQWIAELQQYAELVDISPLNWPPGITRLAVRKRDDRVEELSDKYRDRTPAYLVIAPATRRYEYILGRLAAGAALSANGVNQDHCWIQSLNRKPIWPTGFAGSIAHSSQIVQVTIGRTNKSRRSLGIDIEYLDQPAEALEDLAICFTDKELDLIGSAVHGRVIGFAAKEALFKCVNPIGNVFLDYHDARIVSLDPVRHIFTIELGIDCGQGLSAGTTLAAYYHFAHKHVSTEVHW